MTKCEHFWDLIDKSIDENGDIWLMFYCKNCLEITLDTPDWKNRREKEKKK